MSLSRLELFINTLPKNKVLSDQWTERYIDDVNTFQGYEMTKELAIKRKRYVENNYVYDYGYSIDLYDNCNQDLKQQSNNQQCYSCCDYDEEKEKCIYNADKCNEYFAQNVTNWSEICQYHILFLQGKTPGTPDHPGPWNKETSYIIDPLVKILQKNILTKCSQPGLMLFDDNIEYLQKPYLEIAGPANRIHQILIKVLSNSDIIKYVPYPLKTLEFWGYNNYQEDDQDYVSVVLGIDHPPYLSKEYSEYVLSNSFFDQINNLI